MKAIFVCDNNKTYSDFWEPMAKHMFSKFGLESQLYYLTNEPMHTLFTSKYATVITIPLLEGIPALVQALFAKWYFPSIQSSTEPILICDIDCFLLSKAFIDYVTSQPTLFHLKSYSGNRVPGYYVYGTPSQLNTFFKIGTRTFKEFCDYIMISPYLCNLKSHEVSGFSTSASPDWKYFCSEERYAYACSLDYKDPKRDTMPHPNPGQNRICRSMNSFYEKEKLGAGAYIDYHCPRPYATYKSTIHAILDSA
jgi:hypothetical protein